MVATSVLQVPCSAKVVFVKTRSVIAKAEIPQIAKGRCTTKAAQVVSGMAFLPKEELLAAACAVQPPARGGFFIKPAVGAALREPGSELWDVREVSEFAAGRVPGSRNVPFGELAEGAKMYAEKADGDARLFVISSMGIRSQQAQVRLTKVAGLRNVFSVRGGLAAWEALGSPLSAVVQEAV